MMMLRLAAVVLTVTTTFVTLAMAQKDFDT